MAKKRVCRCGAQTMNERTEFCRKCALWGIDQKIVNAIDCAEFYGFTAQEFIARCQDVADIVSAAFLYGRISPRKA